MNRVNLLLRLRRQGVQLVADGDRMRYRAPKGILTPDVLKALRKCKEVILGVLKAETENEPIPTLPCRPNRVGEHRRFWFSAQRSWKCVECHPPADYSLALTWHKVEEANGQVA